VQHRCAAFFLLTLFSDLGLGEPERGRCWKARGE